MCHLFEQAKSICSRTDRLNERRPYRIQNERIMRPGNDGDAYRANPAVEVRTAADLKPRDTDVGH